MAYKPVSGYGVIGNMRTAALVAMDGSIDWLCYPHFDSPSVFAALLDDKKGGFFRIGPAEGIDARQKQFYWPDTNVLVTRFLTNDGVAEITDFMPVGGDCPSGHVSPVIRHVHAARGTMRLRMDCRPAFDYARARHEVSLGKDGACFSSEKMSLSLTSTVPMRLEGEGTAADFTLNEGAARRWGISRRRSRISGSSARRSISTGPWGEATDPGDIRMTAAGHERRYVNIARRKAIVRKYPILSTSFGPQLWP